MIHNGDIISFPDAIAFNIFVVLPKFCGAIIKSAFSTLSMTSTPNNLIFFDNNSASLIANPLNTILTLGRTFSFSKYSIEELICS